MCKRVVSITGAVLMLVALGLAQQAAAYEPLFIIKGTVKSVEIAEDLTRGVFVTFLVDGETGSQVPDWVLQEYESFPGCPSVGTQVWNYHLKHPEADEDDVDIKQSVYDQSLNALNIALVTGLPVRLLLPKVTDPEPCSWNRINIRGVRVDRPL